MHGGNALFCFRAAFSASVVDIAVFPILQVTQDMKARDVVVDVAQSKRIPRSDGYALFEVVCSGELERPLGEEEKVRTCSTLLHRFYHEQEKLTSYN